MAAPTQVEVVPEVKIAPHPPRLTVVLPLAVLFTIAGGWWMQQAEIVVLATQITEAIPPIPALGALLFLLFLTWALARVAKRFALTRQEVLLIFAFCAVSTAVPACGSLRFPLALTTFPIYYERTAPQWRLYLITPYIPDWLVPKEFAIIRDLYLGRADGRVPWSEWTIPIIVLTVFFLFFWLACSGALSIFERRWRVHERLVFPLLYLPMRATEERPPSGLPPFWKDPLMWIGFSLSAIYNAMNMANAFNPLFPAPGKFYSFDQYLTAPPLNALIPLQLHYRPELVGLGYLMSTEVAFTVWFSYFLFKLESLVGRLLGWQFAGYPFPQEQGLGAYLMTAVLLVLAARWYLLEWLRSLWKGQTHPDEALSSREALIWLLVGFTGCSAIMIKAGLFWPIALFYFALTVIVALVYARIRAEVGAPMVWLFPYYQHKKVFEYTLGIDRLMDPAFGGVRSMTIFSVFTFLARGYFLSYTGTQLENIQLGAWTGYREKLWVRLSVVAVLVGLLVGFYFHLAPYYRGGALNYREGGIWGHWHANYEFNSIVAWISMPEPPNWPKILATILGGVLVLALGFLRFNYPSSPFHPLGFAIAGSYGDLVWWPFLIVWVCKFLVIRYGGGRIYRRTIPFFLGFALGHYVVAGVIWGLWSTTGKAPFTRYAVWFG
ncbi:MAG: hypothetical protein NZ959_02515 [Armatimonadetes bacterium]|nr:hypothetical protein [Armatimonadota bacterium]MDW8120954.1 DUF6785 family protein [Armatimonadota bacterium]